MSLLLLFTPRPPQVLPQNFTASMDAWSVQTSLQTGKNIAASSASFSAAVQGSTGSPSSVASRPPTASLTGKLVFRGNAALNSFAPSLISSGRESMRGGSTINNRRATATLLGKEVFRVASSVSARSTVVTSTGREVFAGTANTAARPPFTTATNGKQVFLGTLNTSSTPAVLVSPGVQRIRVAGAFHSPQATITASGLELISGNSSLSTSPATLLLDGLLSFRGDSTATVYPPQVLADGKETFTGSASADLQAPATLVASGYLLPTGSASLVVPAATLAASGIHIGAAIRGSILAIAARARLTAIGKGRRNMPLYTFQAKSLRGVLHPIYFAKYPEEDYRVAIDFGPRLSQLIPGAALVSGAVTAPTGIIITEVEVFQTLLMFRVGSGNYLTQYQLRGTITISTNDILTEVLAVSVY